MKDFSSQASLNHHVESGQPTVSYPSLPEVAPSLPSSLALPNWLLAILLLTALVERLRQLLLLIIYILQKMQETRKKKEV